MKKNLFLHLLMHNLNAIENSNLLENKFVLNFDEQMDALLDEIIFYRILKSFSVKNRKKKKSQIERKRGSTSI